MASMQKCISYKRSVMGSEKIIMRIKKELPLAVDENLCRLYLNYQNINSICFYEKHYKNFFFSNYLNCYSANLDWFKFQYIPDNSMLCMGRYVEIRVVDSTIFRTEVDKADLLNFILQSLNNEYYIDIYADEFHLPGTLYYKTEHYPHEQLIYGYDLFKKEFKFLSIDKSGQTVKLSTSFNFFLDSVYSLKKDFFRQFQYEQIEHFPSLRLYKKKPEWVDFDIRCVVNQLESYIKSEDVFPLYAITSSSISYLNKEHKIYSGISVYDNFVNYINKLSTSEMISVPFVYGLMEHVLIMKKRIQYIFKFVKDLFSNLEKRKVINSFDDLIRQHSQLVNMCVKENFRFPKIENREKLSAISAELKNRVLFFYKNIYELIKNVDYKTILNNNRLYYGVVGNEGKLLPLVYGTSKK